MNMAIDSENFQAMLESFEVRLRDSETEITNLKRAHIHCPSCGARSLRTLKPKERQFSDLSLPEAVMTVLWELDTPVSVRNLKLRLLGKGYQEKQLGRYGNRLHTVVWRLSDGDNPRIKKLEGDEIIAIR